MSFLYYNILSVATNFIFFLWVVLLYWVAIDLMDLINSVNRDNELMRPHEMLTCLSLLDARFAQPDSS